ncbi:MAG: hypothetical protein CFE45_03185 [Burkholderiales bacterium PBB5]|nr:MAG: hypothetical protein CFE45_03185 [Burkholderiales bacterium PBB5]
MSHAAQASNLASLLGQTARLFPAHTALIHGDQRWTWAQIDARVNALVAALTALGVRRGDRILLQSRNNVAMFESGWAAFRMGCVWVPTNYRLSPAEVAYLGQSSGAVVMVCEAEFAGHAAAVRAASPALRQVLWVGDGADQGADQAAAAAPADHGYEALLQQHLGAPAAEVAVAHDEPLWFFYTSGTTGKPKAAILTHGQMGFVVANHLADLIPGTDERDASIAVAPLSHGAGIHALLNVARGAATVLMPSDKLDPAVFWQLVQQHRVSNLFTVPTIVKMLVEHPAVDEFDHRSLRYVIYAGAPLYRADQRLALRKLGPVLVQYFGLGEVTGCITVLPAHMHSADDADPNAHIGSCGRPRTGMALAILDASAGLTPQRKLIVEYWADGPASELPPGHWGLFAQNVASRDSHSLDEDVKMFFAMHNASFDAGIVAWHLKRKHNGARPITAIRYYGRGTTYNAWGGPGRPTEPVDLAKWTPYTPGRNLPPAFPGYLFDGGLARSSNSSATAANSRTLSFNHSTERQGNRLLLVGVSTTNVGSAATSVSYAGQALTRLASQTSPTGDNRSEMWYLVNPPVGSYAVTVQLNNTNDIVAGAMGFAGVNQTTPFGTVRGSGGDSASACITLANAPAPLVASVVSAAGDAGSVGLAAGQSQAWNAISNGCGWGGDYWAYTDVIGVGASGPGAPVASLCSPLWRARRWSMLAVPLQPAVAN